jgi:gamma-glutamylcyclotransferase (GGCT)/AIG2-like uncharacterized protein YtfP
MTWQGILCKPIVTTVGKTVQGTQMDRVFVYGTLCRGQCREQCWPHTPRRIVTAYVAGRLYDFGAYPGMTPGDHWVRGELWTFTIEQMDETFRVLDEIEDYRGRDDDLYKRTIVDCHGGSPRQRAIPAFTYVYVQDLSAATEIGPRADGVCSWPPERDVETLGRVQKC